MGDYVSPNPLQRQSVKRAPSGKSYVMLLAALLLISATRCTDMHELTRDQAAGMLSNSDLLRILTTPALKKEVDWNDAPSVCHQAQIRGVGSY